MTDRYAIELYKNKMNIFNKYKDLIIDLIEKNKKN